MADAIWPAELPQSLLVSDQTETPPDVVIRSEMDVGPAKARRRLTAGVRIIRASLMMTRAQLALFDDFFTGTIAGGALPFEWTNGRTGQTHDFRIVGAPEYSRVAPNAAGGRDPWRVRMLLEQLPDAPEPALPPPGPDEDLPMMMAGGFEDPEPPVPPAEEAPAPPVDILAFDTTVVGSIDLPFIAFFDAAESAASNGGGDGSGGFQDAPIAGGGIDPGQSPHAPSPHLPIEGGGHQGIS